MAYNPAMYNPYGLQQQQLQPTFHNPFAQQPSNGLNFIDIIDKLGEEYRKMSPDDRMKMKSQVLTTLGSM